MFSGTPCVAEGLNILAGLGQKE